MRYHNILKDNMNNGDGLRVVLFVSGCEHHCDGCHNPITWDKDNGLEFDDKARSEIFTELEKDYISGITISGGDPLAPYNRKEILELISLINKLYPGKTIWIYTGYVWENIKDEFPDLPNLIDVLVDGPFIKEKASVDYPWAGSTNQKVIRFKENLNDDRAMDRS